MDVYKMIDKLTVFLNYTSMVVVKLQVISYQNVS